MVAMTLDHLHLQSADPETTAAFYVDVLSGRITERVDTPMGLRVVVRLGDMDLFVGTLPPDSPLGPAAPFRGLEHIGLGVADIDAACAELKTRGAEFTVEPYTIRPGLRIAFLRGPENVTIELLQRSPA